MSPTVLALVACWSGGVLMLVACAFLGVTMLRTKMTPGLWFQFVWRTLLWPVSMAFTIVEAVEARARTDRLAAQLRALSCPGYAAHDLAARNAALGAQVAAERRKLQEGCEHTPVEATVCMRCGRCEVHEPDDDGARLP